MIDKLVLLSCEKKPVIVLHAGIATEENLQLIIEAKGHKYLCVSRSRLKDYRVVQDGLTMAHLHLGSWLTG